MFDRDPLDAAQLPLRIEVERAVFHTHIIQQQFQQTLGPAQRRRFHFQFLLRVRLLQLVHGLAQLVAVIFKNPVRKEKSPLPGQYRVELRQFILGKPVFCVSTEDALIGLKNPERVRFRIVAVGECLLLKFQAAGKQCQTDNEDERWESFGHESSIAG